MLGRHLLEHPDERLADDLALGFGVGDAGQAVEEPVLRLDVDEVDVEVAPERRLHVLGLAGAQQAVVDEHAGELVADGLVHQGRRHRRVDAPRQSADHFGIPDLAADGCHRLLDDRNPRPGRTGAAHVVQEVLENLLTARGVRHLRMKLHAAETPLRVLHGGDGRLRRGGGDRESGRSLDDRVAVAHPHVLALRKPGEEPGSADDVERSLAVLGDVVARDAATQLMGDELVSVADSEHRDSRRQDPGVDAVGALCIHGSRTTGQHDARRAPPLDLAGGDVARNDLRVDVCLAYPPGDELRVLRTEIDDEHPIEVAVAGGLSGRHQPMPTRWLRCRSLPSVLRAGATITSAFWNSLTLA